MVDNDDIFRKNSHVCIDFEVLHYSYKTVFKCATKNYTTDIRPMSFGLQRSFHKCSTFCFIGASSENCGFFSGIFSYYVIAFNFFSIIQKLY